MTIAILISMLAALVYSLTNYVDKFLVNGVNKIGSSIKTLLVFSTLIAGIVFSPIWLIINGFNIIINIQSLVLILSSAIISIVALYFYFKSLEISDTSIVVVMFQLIPVFSYIMGVIFFNEILSIRQIVGSIIILCSTILISIDFKTKSKKRLKVLPLMTISSFLYALYYILFELAIKNSSYNVCAFYFQISLLVIGVFLLSLNSFRTAFISAIKSNGKKYLSVNIINEFLNLAGMLLENYANVLIPIAIVTVVSRVQVIFVFVIGLIGTILFPKFFNENISKDTVIKKILCITLSIIGFAIAFL